VEAGRRRHRFRTPRRAPTRRPLTRRRPSPTDATTRIYGGYDTGRPFAGGYRLRDVNGDGLLDLVRQNAYAGPYGLELREAR
jgi:hypothetical protein